MDRCDNEALSLRPAMCNSSLLQRAQSGNRAQKMGMCAYILGHVAAWKNVKRTRIQRNSSHKSDLS